jgi:hypothetical protein
MKASDDNDDDDQIIEDNSHGQEGRPKSKIIQIERKAKTPRSERPPLPLTLNTTLTQLNLRCSSLEEAAAAIAGSINVNKALTTLHLRRNRIRAKGATKIAKALQVNHLLPSHISMTKDLILCHI